MTLVNGMNVSVSGLAASAFGSATEHQYFVMGPHWKHAVGALKVGSLSGTGNLKCSFHHAAQNPSNETPDWKLLMSFSSLNASSAMSTIFDAPITSTPLLPYGRFTSTVESTNAGTTTFYNVVAKLLAEV